MPRKKQPATEEVSTQDELPAESVTLRLRENHFVRGVFAPGGSLHEFPREEAERRLATTQLWDKA